MWRRHCSFWRPKIFDALSLCWKMNSMIQCWCEPMNLTTYLVIPSADTSVISQYFSCLRKLSKIGRSYSADVNIFLIFFLVHWHARFLYGLHFLQNHFRFAHCPRNEYRKNISSVSGCIGASLTFALFFYYY